MYYDESLKEPYIRDFIVSHRKELPLKNAPHFHDRFEIFLNMTDNLIFFLGNKSYTLNRGDIMLLNNMDIHLSTTKAHAEYERYVVLFRPEYASIFSTENTDLLELFWDQSLDYTRCIHLNEDELSLLIPLLHKARYYSSQSVYGAEIYIKVMLVEILLMINSFAQSKGHHILELNNEKEYIKIKPVLQFIKEHLNEELTLQALSEAFYFNKHYLLRLFKKVTGTTISNYIVNLRILKSRELLKKGHSITEVCERVGFNSYTHFITTFKKYTGITPKKYMDK